MQNLPFTAGQLLSLAEDENKLRQLYFDYKFSQWKNDFLKNNGIQMNSIMKEKIALMEEFFEFEGEGDNRKVKFTTPAPIPKKEAVYKTEVVTPKSLFRKEATKQVLVSEEVPEQPQAGVPVCKEGKTIEQYNKAYREFCAKEKIMKL